MSHLPPFDATSVPTTTRWIEAVGYCDVRKLNVATSLSTSYTQPAIGSTVTISVGSSTAFAIGDTVAVSGALATYRGGVYCIDAKPSSTTLTLRLLERGLVAPGSTVASGADVRSISPILVTALDRGPLVVTELYCDSLTCPGIGDTTRATISIGWNKGGTPFSEFYSAQQLNFASTRSSGQMAASIAATFVQPAVGALVAVRLAAPAAASLGSWGFPLNTTVEVLRSGVYRVAGFVTTTTTTAFVEPSLNASVTINVVTTTDFAVGDFVWSSTPTIPAVGLYEITAKTSTSLTVTSRNAGSSFVTAVQAGTTSIPIGSTIWNAHTLQLELLRDPQTAAGQTVPSGASVLRYWPDAATVTAPFIIYGIGNSNVYVDDNRQFTVGTSVMINVSPTSSAGIFTVIDKRGVNLIDLDSTTTIDYAIGSTAPAGASMLVWRQAGQVLPLRGTGTTRLAVDPGSVIAAYISVAGNATAADVIAIHLRGYYVS